PRDVQFFLPFITVVDSKGIRSTDAILLAHEEVIGVTGIACITTVPSTAVASTSGAAPTTATTGYTQQVFSTKILLVNIIKQSHQRQPAIPLKETYIPTCGIPVIRAISCIRSSKLSISGTRFGYDVDR